MFGCQVNTASKCQNLESATISIPKKSNGHGFLIRDYTREPKASPMSTVQGSLIRLRLTGTQMSLWAIGI